MNNKFKGRIISALRKLTFSWPERSTALKAAKIAPATYECEICRSYIYDGTSDKTLSKVSESLPKPVTKGKVHVDHKEPVVPIEGFSQGVWDWDEYINRMFCDINGIQVICSDCHKIKTDSEKSQRKELTAKKKCAKKEGEK